MTSARVFGRLKLLAPALIALGLGVVLLGFATSRSSLECSRQTNTCTWTQGSFGSRDVSTFPMTNVREVRLVEGLGKHGRDAATMLVFANGRDTTFGRSSHDDAERHFLYTRDFFDARGTTPTYRYATGGAAWPYGAALACLVAAVVLGVQGFRKRVIETVPTKWNGKLTIERTVGEQAARKRRIHQTAAVIGALVAASIVVLVVGNRGKGTLALECRTRCMLGGMECMPGAKSDIPYEPGTHTVQVWTGTGSNWRPATFEITAGETTTFVCE